MDYKPLPIGIENFEKMIKNDYYYVDKTLLIKELIDNKAEVNLFTRPRRFGKSLTISMLQYFFEMGIDGEGCPTDTTHLFDGLNIMKCGKKYADEMNKYPVINITLKDADQSNYRSSFRAIMRSIKYERRRHGYLMESNKLNQKEKDDFYKLDGITDDDELSRESLRIMSGCLEKHYGRKVLILIDEYDVPLLSAYFKGYYDEMVGFIRSFFGNALKSNPSLAFAVVTGCLRISRSFASEASESIFTGLNNLNVVSIVTKQYGEYFGFTEDEVQETLTYYDLDHKL